MLTRYGETEVSATGSEKRHSAGSSVRWWVSKAYYSTDPPRGSLTENQELADDVRGKLCDFLHFNEFRRTADSSRRAN